MKTLEIQKRNHRLEDVKFEDNAQVTVAFEHKGGILAAINITKGGGTNVIFSNGKAAIPQIEKFIGKYMDSEVLFEEGQSLFNVLQKRIKGYIAFSENSEEQAPETESPEAEELPELKSVPAAPKTEAVSASIPEPVRTEAYVAPKPALGLEGVIAQMVTDGINDHSTTKLITSKVQKFLTENGIVPNRTEIVVKRVDGTTANVGSQHYLFNDILTTISAGVNLALVGPAGSGKTSAVANSAKALGLKFYSKSVSAQTGAHEFFGYQDANGNYVRTLFREAYEFGGVFLVDEFDAGNPNVLASLNQATANGSCAFADGMIHKHPDFVVVMAGNTFGHGATSEYVGRNKIDAATLDRFAFLYFPYDEKLETEIVANKEWVKKVQALRKKVAEKRIKTIISPRASIDGAKLLAQGMSESMVMELLIYKGLSNDERALLS